MRRTAIGEIVSAAIILGTTAVVATIMLNILSEQAQTTTDDMRSRLDIMRAQAVEQLDIISRADTSGEATFIVINYGDFPTSIPFLIYDKHGINIQGDVKSYILQNGTDICTGSYVCPTPYTESLDIGEYVQVTVRSAANKHLILVTDTGRPLETSSP